MQRKDEKILEPNSEKTDDIKPTRSKQQEERDLFELKGNVITKANVYKLSENWKKGFLE